MKTKIIAVFLTLIMVFCCFFASASTVNKKTEKFQLNSLNRAEIPTWLIGNYWKYDMNFIFVSREGSLIKFSIDARMIIQNEIKERLSEYIRYPEVTVSVKEFAGNKIIILGAITYPGIYTYRGAMTVVEAIAMARDFTSEGKRESVIVVSDNLTEHPKA